MVSRFKLLFKKIMKTKTIKIEKKLEKEYKFDIEYRDFEYNNMEVYTIIASDKNGNYNNHITVSQWATHNCQVSTIGGIHQLTNATVRTFEKVNKKEFEDDFVQLIKKRSKRQCLIDVVKEYYDEIIPILERNSEDFHIMFEQPYKNSTGTNMIMIMFKWDEEDYDDDYYDDDEDWDDDY